MKNISTIKLLGKSAAISLACILSISSCVKEDLLDRENPAAVTGSKAWTTPYLTKLGMNGVYAAIRQGVDVDNGTTSREIYSYDQFGSGQTNSGTVARREIILGGASTSNELFKEVWKDLYEGVGRSCDAIQNIPLKSECDDATKAKYIAEAKFLRAFFYFRLNQLYKGVPIYETAPSMDDNSRPRSTEAQVWEFILNDLNDCIKEEKLVNKYAKGNVDYGKVTKGAAYALRGKVYMYMGEWRKAINDFNEVEKCGYGLFQGNYKDLFTEANEQSDEMIFSIQNIEVLNYGSSQHFHSSARSAFGMCWNTFSPSAHTVDLYNNADGSEFDWDKIIPGYKAMPTKDREVYFLRDTLNLRDNLFATGKFKNITEAGKSATSIISKVNDRLKTLPANVRTLYLHGGNEARIKKAYENRDPRLSHSVITPYSDFMGAFNTDAHLVTLRWPYAIENIGVDDFRSDNQAQLLYFHRKFVHEGASLSIRGASPIDQPIIRYADVLLMKAEAYAELNQIAEAVACVNPVRARAGVGLLNTSPETTVKDKADLVNRIRNERRVEFVNEGISYFDELRWDTWKQTVFEKDKNGNEPGRQLCTGGVVRGYIYDGDKLKVWPIPLSEIEMNPSLTQNPGW